MKVLVATFAFTTVLIAQSSDSVTRELKTGKAAAVAAPSLETEISAASRTWKNSELTVMVNKSLVLDQPAGIRRISIATADIAEAAAASAHEVLVNGKAPGDTSLLVWDSKGNRQAYEVHVIANTSTIDTVRSELAREVGPGASLTLEDKTVFLRGVVKNSIAADRATAIASTLGKVVNLLQVEVPASEPQILLKVRFADIDRSAALQLGINLFALNPKGIASSSTGQFGSAPTVNLASPGTSTLTNLLNLFYFNPEINVGAMLQDLQTRNILQILAEPDLLTMSGRPASFLAGGEFPFPTLQGGGAGVGQITIQFKEFGIRLNFLPTVTPRGTIHLLVTPEVSSLDYANGLTVNGFTIPGLDTRRVQTEVELQNGQSFAIAGLLDNQVTEQLDKMPGIGSIPILGKLFQSKSYNRSKTELLVTVTPELVSPIPAGVKTPELKFPVPFFSESSKTAPQTSAPGVSGPGPAFALPTTLPVEQLKNWVAAIATTGNSGTTPVAAQTASLSQPPQQLPPASPPAQPSPPPNK